MLKKTLMSMYSNFGTSYCNSYRTNDHYCIICILCYSFFQEDKPFDFDDYSSATEMEVLGLEKLKSLLIERGMKCGGTLQQRAERLFTVKGLDPKDIDPSLLAKPSKGKGKK